MRPQYIPKNHPNTSMEGNAGPFVKDGRAAFSGVVMPQNARFQGPAIQPTPTVSTQASNSSRDLIPQNARFQRSAVQPSSTVQGGEEISCQSPESQGSDNHGRADERNAGVNPTPGPSNMSMGRFTISNNEQQNSVGLGGNNNTEQLGTLQINTAPSYTTSMYDPVGANIPLKIKEKIWAGELNIELSLLLKSAKDLIHDPQFNGDLAVKGGHLAGIPQKPFQIKQIHVWTSAYIIYMGMMLEKWPNKGSEYLKYMYNVRLAAVRGSGNGWVAYDEQYRLRKARFPFTTWGDIDMELCLLYVATNVNKDISSQNGMQAEASHTFQRRATFLAANRGFQGGPIPGNRRVRTCIGFNKGSCKFGKNCKFAHKCTNCYGSYPETYCKA